jgi:O-antigen biosynthesis protein
MPETAVQRIAPSSASGGSNVVIHQASRLSTGVLLLVGTFGEQDRDPEVMLRKDGNEIPLESQSFAYELPAAPGGEGSPRTLLMVFMPTKGQPPQPRDMLLIRTATGVTELGWRELRQSLDELKTLARDALGPLEGCGRAEAMRFLAKALAVQPTRGAILLSETLFGLRAGLRERLPGYVHAPDQPLGLALESIMAIDDRSFYIEGWVRDEEAEIVRLTAVSPEGDRAELAQNLYRFARADVTNYFSGGVLSRQDPGEKAGFLSFLELESPSFLSSGWILEMEDAEGNQIEVAGPLVLRDAAATRSRVLADSGRERVPDDDLMEHHVMPALNRIQQRVEEAIKIDSVTDFGTPPASPTVSAVIPLYRRIDLIEQQLAEFVQDPEMFETELIYVLDSPEQMDELLFLASRLYPVYRVPIRIAVLQRNVGFAGANNAGASIARGRILLLMNSDVLPDKPGWLGDMTRFYDSTPNVGALAPKLLYEDGSIQNAGMYFYRQPGMTLWTDAHYYRGLHRDFPPANIPRKVPLVSGACVMISSALYRELGGLQGVYVQGDYEDSDLCMRLMKMGRDNWYYPRAEVFHLEALSYAPSLRMPANRYNAWLHTHLWKDEIERLVAEQEASSNGAQ